MLRDSRAEWMDVVRIYYHVGGLVVFHGNNTWRTERVLRILLF